MDLKRRLRRLEGRRPPALCPECSDWPQLQIVKATCCEEVPHCCWACGRPVFTMQVLRGVSLDEL